MALPNVRLTASAAEQLGASLGPGDFLHLCVDDAFSHDLAIGPKQDGDIALESGTLTLLVDAPSATRVDGLTIDFVSGDATGFRFRNPNAPPSVEDVSPAEARTLLEQGKIQLLDVRTNAERVLAKVDGARPYTLELLLSLDRAQPVAFLCHKGSRSASTASQALKEGFRTVYNVAGGIDAWSITVDRSIRRY